MGITKIPQVNNQNKDFQLYQTQLQKSLQPVLSNPQNFGTTLTSVSLASGSNTINTGLNAPLQGWYIIRQRSAASIYDDQDNNPNPDTSLILVSSAAVVVDIRVF